MEKGGWGDFFDAFLDLEGVTIEGAYDGTPLRVGVSGRLKATGTSKEPRISADLQASSKKLVRGGIAVGRADVRIVGSSTGKAADLSRIEAALSGLVIKAAPGKTISFEKLALAGTSHLDLAGKSARADASLTGVPGLPAIVLSGRAGPGRPPAAEIHLECRGVEIPALRTLGAPFLPESLAAWEFGGTADLSLDAGRASPVPGAWRIAGAVSLADARFNDPSFAVAGEGLDPAFRFEGTLSPARTLAFTAGLDIGKGGSLWKTAYIPWSRHPLKASFSGIYQPGTRALENLSARFASPALGEIGVSGALRASPPAFELKIDSRLDLAPLVSLTVRPGAAASDGMNIEGTLGAALFAHGAGGALSVGGRLSLAGASFASRSSGAGLFGVAADIPVLYSSAGSTTAPREDPWPERGSLRIAEVRTPLLTIEPLEVAVRTGTNAFAVEPLSFELFGGRLELGRTEFGFDPGTRTLAGRGSLVLRELDVAKLPIPPQFKLTGRVRAEFPGLEISPRKIAVSGRGEADIFGGRVVLRDLAVDEPFAAGRSISLDADLLDLDLKKLTDEIPFGEVTGILRGEIRGLVISYGQPAAFDLRIESVRRKGVPQTFSLKAVDNLTVLSSGRTASAGTAPFWMRFVRGFRYSRLGIVSTLRNDTFSLNGTIHEGGVEYLVKKPALFGINVVNRMPDKKISFKEMMSRLKRVGQTEKPPASR